MYILIKFKKFKKLTSIEIDNTQYIHVKINSLCIVLYKCVYIVYIDDHCLPSSYHGLGT